MNRIVATLILTTALATPLQAQDAQVTGTVAEVFGTQIVLATPEGRLLVTLPEDAATAAPGTRLDLTGTRTGQTFTATAARVSAGPAADPAEGMLPAPLRGLGLTDIRIRPDNDGDTHIYARHATGWLRAEARGDRLSEVQADGAGLPQSLVDTMLPAAARAEPRLADITRLTEIDLDDDGKDGGKIEVEGHAADGMRVEIEFSRDGRLRDYERDRDDRRSLTVARARERLVALGYTDVGYIERGGRHVTALAVNPHGDTVEVRLDDQGRVERERLWLN